MTNKLTKLWLKYALDDLNSAEVLITAEIYNMVCFHSQQASEKLFKAFIASSDQTIPRIHNLSRLYKICKEINRDLPDIDPDWILFLNDIYIDSRYPADFGILPYGQPGKNDALMAFKYAKGIDNILRPVIEKSLY